MVPLCGNAHYARVQVREIIWFCETLDEERIISMVAAKSE